MDAALEKIAQSSPSSSMSSQEKKEDKGKVKVKVKRPSGTMGEWGARLLISLGRFVRTELTATYQRESWRREQAAKRHRANLAYERQQQGEQIRIAHSIVVEPETPTFRILFKVGEPVERGSRQGDQQGDQRAYFDAEATNNKYE